MEKAVPSCFCVAPSHLLPSTSRRSLGWRRGNSGPDSASIFQDSSSQKRNTRREGTTPPERPSRSCLCNAEVSKRTIQWHTPKTALEAEFKQLASNANLNAQLLTRQRREFHQKWTQACENALFQLESMDPKKRGKIVASILNSCRQGAYQNRNVFEKMAKIVLKHEDCIESMTPLQVAMIVYALAVLLRDIRLRYPSERRNKLFPRSPILIATMLGSCLERDLFSSVKFNARELSNLAYGLGWLYDRKYGSELHENVENGFDAMIKEFVVKAEGNLGGCKTIWVANCLDACAKVEYNDQEALGGLCGVLKKKLNNGGNVLKASTLSGLTWTLAELKYDDAELIDMLAERLSDNINECDNASMAQAIHSLGVLNYDNQNVLDVIILNAATGWRLPQYTTREFTTMAVGIGAMSCTNKEVVLAFMDALSSDLVLKYYTSEELAKIVYWLARCQSFDGVVYGTLIKQYEVSLGSCSIPDMCKMAVGLANTKDVENVSHLVVNLFDSMLREIKKRVKVEENNQVGIYGKLVLVILEQEVGELCWAFSELGYVNAEFLDLLSENYLMACKENGKVDADEAVGILTALAKLGYSQSGALIEFLENNLPSLSIEHICGILSSYAILGVLQKPLLENGCRLLSKLVLNGDELSENDKQSLLHAWVYGQVILDGHFDSQEVQTMGACLENSTFGEFQQEIGGEVSEVLHELGQKSMKCVKIEKLCMEVAALIQSDPPIVVDVGKWNQFESMSDVSGPSMPLGLMSFRRRLMEASGYKVISLSSAVWEKIDTVERRNFLEREIGVVLDD